MKAIGIIAEFNPFHKGHAYLIQQAKKETSADYCVIAMSGDFVQRGEPACMDKYIRTRIALEEGADLVLELPTIWATASAEYFARGAIDMLAATSVIDTLCFGTEHPEFPYEHVAKLLLLAPEEFQLTLKEHLSNGDSFPAARMAAILEYSKNHPMDSNNKEIHVSPDALAEPNTILGIEYAKAAIKNGLAIHPVKRVGNSYNDASLSGEFLSASAIRKQIASVTDVFVPGVSDKENRRIIEYYKTKQMLNADSVSDMLYHVLLQHREKGYTQFFDCDTDLSNRIIKNLKDYESFSQFITLLKTKNYTYSRISRVLIHILLSITTEDVTHIPMTRVQGFYLRILGFRKDSSEILSKIKEDGFLPLISKMADVYDKLPETALEVLKKDIYAAEIYEQLAKSTSGKRIEISQSPIVF